MMTDSVAIKSAPLPVSYEAAKKALGQCVNIDECKDWSDKAVALASYAKQANDKTLVKLATRINARAIRRSGELLRQIEAQHGANQNITAGDHLNVLTRTSAARNAGLSEHQQKQAVRVASIPETDFNQQVESDEPPTVTELARQGVKKSTPPIDPESYLQGRDSETFKMVMNAFAEPEAYAKATNKTDWNAVLPHLTDKERRKLRTLITSIDAIHDQIMTRI